MLGFLFCGKILMPKVLKHRNFRFPGGSAVEFYFDFDIRNIKMRLCHEKN